MKNRDKIKNLFIFTVILFLFSGNNIYSQVSDPDSVDNLHRRSEGDSVSFNIYGDKKIQVETTVIPVEPLPLPERIKPPQDVVADYGIMEKESSFKPVEGTRYFGNASLGSHNFFKLESSVVHGGEDYGFALNLKSRIAEENTPENLAPSVQELSFRGYLETESFKYGGNLDIAGHNDNFPDKDFRPGGRKANLFGVGGYIDDIQLSEWKLGGRVKLTGGSFNDFPFGADENELGLKGNFNVFRDFDVFYLGFHSSIEKYGIAGNTGSILSAGFSSGWLMYNRIGIKPGGDFHIFDVPGRPAKGRFYPKIGIEGAITQNIRLTMNIAPSIKTYNFRELFFRNGLISSPVPIAVEDRKNEVNGEVEFILPSGADFSIGGFYTKTGDFPVFSRSGDFFSLSSVKDVTLYGAEMKFNYQYGEDWNANGNIRFNNTKWDYDGKVPYIPAGEGALSIFYNMNRLWKFKSLLSYYGKHYIEIGSKETQNSFATVDVGFERNLSNISALFSIELRNITNSKGAWWTSEYKSPGIGIYTGIKLINGGI